VRRRIAVNVRRRCGGCREVKKVVKLLLVTCSREGMAVVVK
jgi:hypothetical protein